MTARLLSASLHPAPTPSPQLLSALSALLLQAKKTRKVHASRAETAIHSCSADQMEHGYQSDSSALSA